MAFDTLETSTESGRPIELYRFDFGTEEFNFTNHDVGFVFGGVAYEPASIKRSNLEASREDEVNAITLTMEATNPVAQRYIGIVPGRRATVQIEKTHAQEIGGTEESAQIFDGFIATVSFKGLLEARVKCRPATTVFRRPGPRFQYSGLCNHVLYDARCKINRQDFRHDGTVTGVSGNVLTVSGVSGFAADFFVSGFAEFPPDSGRDFRLILSQGSPGADDVALLLPFGESVLGQTISLFAGCDHSLVTCDTKFDNVINYGGFPFIPRKNPFNSRLR